MVFRQYIIIQTGSGKLLSIENGEWSETTDFLKAYIFPNRKEAHKYLVIYPQYNWTIMVAQIKLKRFQENKPANSQ